MISIDAVRAKSGKGALNVQVTWPNSPPAGPVYGISDRVSAHPHAQTIPRPAEPCVSTLAHRSLKIMKKWVLRYPDILVVELVVEEQSFKSTTKTRFSLLGTEFAKDIDEKSFFR